MRSISHYLPLAFLLARSLIALAAEGPKLEAFLPAGGQCGTSADVQLIGEFSTSPLKAWTRSSDLVLEVSPEGNNRLQVTIAKDARPGVHWIRLFNEQGATSLHPFVVETVREILEVDTQPQQVDLATPCIVNGRLANSNEVDEYEFQLAAGETVNAKVNAHRPLGSPMDTVMQILDVEHGITLAQNDDAPGLDPKLSFTARRNGTYRIRLFAFPETPNQTIGFAGGDNFVYRLTLTKGAIFERTMPLSSSEHEVVQVAWDGAPTDDEPTTIGLKRRLIASAHTNFATVFQGDVPGWRDVPLLDVDVNIEADSATPKKVYKPPFMITGRISSANELDTYQFRATQGETHTIELHSRTLGFPLDAVLVLKDEQGKQLAKNDDANGRDARLEFVVPQDGLYEIEVSDLHDRGGDPYLYELSVRQQQPSFALESAANVMSVAKNQDLEVPVKVIRRHGFQQDIHVTAVELPAGVTVGSATSVLKPDAEESSVKLVLRGAAAFSGSFRILGLTESSATYVLADSEVAGGARSADFWLTVTDDDATESEVEQPEKAD